MDARILITKLEAAVSRQVLLGGGQPEVEAAADALLGVLEPALKEAALELAEQAASEIAAQVSGYEIDLVVAEGDAELRVRPVEGEVIEIGAGEPLDARITLRLPPQLKEIIESYADEKGESVNSWLVKALGGLASRPGRSSRSTSSVSGRIQT